MTFTRTEGVDSAETVAYTVEAADSVETGNVTFAPGEAAVSTLIVPVREPGGTDRRFTVTVLDGGGATATVTLPARPAAAQTLPNQEDGGPGPAATNLPDFETIPVVAVTVRRGPDGELVGLDIEGIGTTGDKSSAVNYADDAPPEGTTTQVAFLPGPIVAGALRALATRPDQSEALNRFLQQRPFNVEGFRAAVQALETPLSGNELDLLLWIARGGWDEAVSAGRNPGVAQIRATQEVRQAAARKVLDALQEQPAGSGYVLTRDAVYALWGFYKQTPPANMTPAEARRWQQIKDEAFKVLNPGYGKLYWAGKVSPPNAARDAGAAADRLIPGLDSDSYETREQASADLARLIQKYTTDRNYEGFKALVAKLKAAATTHPSPEVRARAERLLKAFLHIDMYLAGL